jgi:branched-chain amino acid transport system ATP-binding protein
MAPLLEVDSVVAGYGNTRVLKSVSLQLGSGEAFAVLGANGAGKSTLMKTLVGLLFPREGRVVFDGEDVTRLPAEERAKRGLVLAPEGRGIFATLSIEENLLIGGTAVRKRLGGRAARREIAGGLERAYSAFPVLGSRKGDFAWKLSGGQQQMLAIARALMASPRLLLLDEPCLGLAPKVGNDVYAALRRLREQGQSLIVVEESSQRALGFADRACVLKVGEKVLEDRADAMRSGDTLLNAYFGLVDSAAVAQ